MRTTLTIDDDVARRLRRMAPHGRFKHTVNQALRLGIAQIERNQRQPAPAVQTRVFDQPLRVSSVDNVAEVLDRLGYQLGP